MKTPEELKKQLIDLFPEFENELDEEDDCDFGKLSFHRIWMEFATVSHRYLAAASDKTMLNFCKLTNDEVTAGLDRENAISTCFLEHASQLGVKKLLRPLLNGSAKKELR